MMIEKSGSIRLRDIPVAGNLPPEQQALAAGMVRVTHQRPEGGRHTDGDPGRGVRPDV